MRRCTLRFGCVAIPADSFWCRDAVMLSLSEPLHCHCHHLPQTQDHSRGNRAGLVFSRAPMGAMIQPLALLLVARLPPTWVSPACAERRFAGSMPPVAISAWVLLQPRENAASPKSLTHSHHPSPTAGWLRAGAGLGRVRAAQPWRAAAGAAARPPSDCIAAAPACCLPALPHDASPIDSTIRNISPSRMSSHLKITRRGRDEPFALRAREAGIESAGSQQRRCSCFPHDAQNLQAGA